MRIIINNSSMQPIYEQLINQIKALIIDGSLKENDALMSVRALSSSLKISALTVKKAYDILEEEGLIKTIHGKGSFVSSVNTGLIMEEKRKRVEIHLYDVINEARSYGMTDKELSDLFNIIMED